ncbi:MAG: cell wall hydrolase [Hyphomonadaceae bacterium]|nr:cell wall hydrolase [Hyphomonadaceae bacterium]
MGHRFEVQKTEEAYRADAVVLAQSLSPRHDQARLVSFTNKASAGAVLQSVSYALDQDGSEGLAALPLRDRDSRVLAGLSNFTAQNVGAAEQEQSEMDCLAEAVYYEARSEDTRGQMAVAEVVMNRVKNPHFPKSVCGVVFQGQYRNTGCQFTFTCDGSTRRQPYGESWDRARAVALHVMMGLNKPVTNKATHYHTDYVNPYWKAGLVETAEIGTHIFYRFPKTGAEWSKARVALAAQDRSNGAYDPLAGDVAIPVAQDADSLAAAQLVKISADTKKEIVPAVQNADNRAL